MKIKDLIKLEKRHSKKIKGYNNNFDYYYENQTQRNYEKKKGYYWRIPSHSKDESCLLNNYERDCVIAYIDNLYMTIFLIKIRGKDNYKTYISQKNILKCLIGSYPISKIYNQNDVIKAFDKDINNLKIVENKEYSRFKKLKILEAIGGGN